MKYCVAMDFYEVLHPFRVGLSLTNVKDLRPIEFEPGLIQQYV